MLHLVLVQTVDSIMILSRLLLSLLLVSCGKYECLNREQVRAICLSDKIKSDNTRWKVPYYIEDCEDDFPYEQCYPKDEYLK